MTKLRWVADHWRKLIRRLDALATETGPIVDRRIINPALPVLVLHRAHAGGMVPLPAHCIQLKGRRWMCSEPCGLLCAPLPKSSITCAQMIEPLASEHSNRRAHSGLSPEDSTRGRYPVIATSWGG